jgi:anti-sigma B factor antagonist
MSLQPAQLLVRIGDREVCVKIIGRANFLSGPDFQMLANELHARGFRRFLIDAGECGLMDSTFLGVLCGLGLKLQRAGGGEARGVELFNTNARLTELVESLGADELLRITAGPVPLAGASETATTETTSRTREEIARTSLEAHRTLMSLSPENAARFKDVAQFLAEDLKRLKSRD